MSLEKKNYYERLGLTPDATHEQIREAYRDIARVYHPDSNFFGDLLGEALPLSEHDLKKFRLVTEAYHTLVNEPRRRKYDESLAAAAGWRSPGAATRRHKPSDAKSAPGSRANAAQVRVRVKDEAEDAGPPAAVRSVAEMIREQRAAASARGTTRPARKRKTPMTLIISLVAMLLVVGILLRGLL